MNVSDRNTFPRRPRALVLWTSRALLGVSLFTVAAHADPSDAERAGARAAATAGVEAFDAERWQEAVDYFLRAESIVHSPVHLSYIGRARAQLGQLVLAREALMKVVHEQATSPAAERAKEDAETTLAQIEPRIPALTIKVDGALGREVQVTVDGAALLPALIGIPGPVDPGKHVVVASAGTARTEQEVVLSEAEAKTITLLLPPPTAGDDAVPVAAGDQAPAPAESGASSKKGGLVVGSIVGFGVGAIGIGLGVGFGLMASDKNEQASQLCLDETGTRSCSGLAANDPVAVRVQELDGAAADARTASTVAFVAGGVSLAVGTTLLLLSLKPKRAEVGTIHFKGVGLRPVVALDYLGVAGTF